MTTKELPAMWNVVFDMDGTLVDSAPGIERCLRQSIAVVAPSARPECPVGLIGPPVRDMISGLLPGADPVLVDAAVAAFRQCYDGGGWRDTVPYANTDEMLADLRAEGLRLFIVTNKPHIPTGLIMANLGWDVLFDDIVCRDSGTPPFADKSLAMAHLIACHELDRSRTVMVGDSADDALAAAANGVAFAAACWGYGEASSHSDDGCLLRDPGDLMRLLHRV